MSTPCCGAWVLLRSDEAVPGAVLGPVCPHDGVDWALELIADATVESGLRAVWTAPQTPARAETVNTIGTTSESAATVHRLSTSAITERTAPSAAADPSPAAAERGCRVEVTATSYILRPPCCPTAPIILARDVTEPLALDHLECLACGVGYDVALLGDPDQGLWVCWREQKRPRP